MTCDEVGPPFIPPQPAASINSLLYLPFEQAVLFRKSRGLFTTTLPHKNRSACQKWICEAELRKQKGRVLLITGTLLKDQNTQDADL